MTIIAELMIAIWENPIVGIKISRDCCNLDKRYYAQIAVNQHAESKEKFDCHKLSNVGYLVMD